MLKEVCKAVAVASLLACGGGGSDSVSPPPPPPPPPPGGVSITNDAYTPASRTVTVGSNVSWVWNTCSGDVYGTGQQCASHNVTFDDGVASPTQDQGSYVRTFTVAGTYTYHCTVHPAMTGTITVQ